MGLGHYRFEGRARCAGVVPNTGPKGNGAGIRASLGSRSTQNELVRDADWTDLTYEFDFNASDGGEEIELICELRAEKGEVWFDLGSLRLVRLGDRTQ